MAADDNGFTFEDVVVDRAGVRALDGFSATVPGDGVTAVFGPSGAGKSTLLRLCNRLEVPTSGRVLFGERDIAGLDPLRLRRQVGMGFQKPTPFPGTVADNLRVASPRATDGQLREVLARVALTGDWLDRDATALSGGEAQRVCLARAFAHRPRLLLADEPTASLDVVSAAVVSEMLLEAAPKYGITPVIATHDPRLVEKSGVRHIALHAKAVGPSEVECRIAAAA